MDYWPDLDEKVRLRVNGNAGHYGRVLSIHSELERPLYIKGPRGAGYYLPSEVAPFHQPWRPLSSGRHQSLNRQPWALIEYTDDGRSGVNARFTWKAEAGASFALYPPAPNEKLEWDPIAWDAEPLTNPANPIVADLRDEHGNVNQKAIDWWESMLHDWYDSDPDGPPPAPYIVHASRVIARYRAVFTAPASH